MNVAGPDAAFASGIVITVDFPAATFTAALPAMPFPARLAVASSCAGQATPESVYLTLTTFFVAVSLAGTSAAPGFERSSAKWTRLRVLMSKT